MLEIGIIEPSDSEYSTPILVLSKKKKKKNMAIGEFV